MEVNRVEQKVLGIKVSRGAEANAGRVNQSEWVSGVWLNGSYMYLYITPFHVERIVFSFAILHLSISINLDAET